jgi:DNA-binding beta-propeller fold protein YncE
MEKGTVVIANRGSGSISLIDVASDMVMETIVLPGVAPEPMYANYARGKLFVGDRGGNQVVVYDAKNFSMIGTVPAGNGVFHQWAHKNSKQLWVVNDVDKTATVIDTKDLSVLMTVPMPEDLVMAGYVPHDVYQHPSESFAYVTMLGMDPGYVVQFDSATFMETARVPVGDDPHLSMSKQQNQLFVASQFGNQVHVFDPVTLDEITVLDVPGAHGAWTTKDGKYFFTTNLPGGGTDGIFSIDIRTLSVIDSVNTPFAVPHNIVVTRNKLYLTHSGGTSDKVTVWSIGKKMPVPVYLGDVTVGLNPFGLTFIP